MASLDSKPRAICESTFPLADPAKATAIWDQLSARIDALIGAWQSERRPPEIAQFLSAESSDTRRLSLIELICWS